MCVIDTKIVIKQYLPLKHSELPLRGTPGVVKGFVYEAIDRERPTGLEEVLAILEIKERYFKLVIGDTVIEYMVQPYNSFLLHKEDPILYLLNTLKTDLRKPVKATIDKNPLNRKFNIAPVMPKTYKKPKRKSKRRVKT